MVFTEIGEGVNSLPNFVIAGVNKGGTTSLYSYLSQHPDVGASSIKETCFFLTYRYGETPHAIEEYEKYFESCVGKKCVMESTPGYFYGGMKVASEIKETLGDVKIAIVLRDPVDRLFSFYRFMKSMLKLDVSVTLEEYINACMSIAESDREKRENNVYWGVDGGFYDRYLPAWMEVFGDDLRIVFFDDLAKDPRAVLLHMAKWLDIDPAPFGDINRLGVENRTVSYRNRQLHALALKINSQAERVFRRYPGFKRTLRHVYYRFNEGKNVERLSDDMRMKINEIYVQSNKRLANMLMARHEVNLPIWLKNN